MSVQMKFGESENVLIKVSHLDPVRVGAFKARIRNLRRFNSPNVIENKKGLANIEYTRLNAIELAIALAPERNRLPPKFSAPRAIHWAPLVIRSIADKPDQVHYLAIIASFNLIEESDYLSLIGRGIEFIKDALDASPAAIVINTSMLVSQVDAAIRGEPLPPLPVMRLNPRVEGLYRQCGDVSLAIRDNAP